MTFTWLNKQGVESDLGFVVQFTGRFTCEYRESGHILEFRVESGGGPMLDVSSEDLMKWRGPLLHGETLAQQQARIKQNVKAAMEFQGLLAIV